MHHCSIEEDENEIGVVGMDDVSTNMTTIPRCHHKNGRHTGNGKMTMPRDKQKFGSGRHGYVDYCGNLVEPFDTNTVVNPKRERPSFLLTTSMSQSTFSSNSPPPTPPTKLQNWLRKWTRRKNSESSNDDCSLPSSSVSLSTSSTPSSSALHRKCHSSNLTMSGVNNNATRRIVLKAFQITSVLICLVCLYTLVDNVLYLAKSYNHNKNNNSESSSLQSSAYSAGSSMMSANNNLSSFAIYDQLQSWIVNQDHFTNSLSTFATNNGSIKSKSLLQIKNFRFVLNNASICAPDVSHRRRSSSSSSSISQHDKIFFMILVHSAPDHFEERQAIRSTWGSVKTLKSWGIRLIFLLGKDSDPDSEFVERSIVRESEIFGDIVSGNFIDSYRNLTYKHLMGYKWALNYCPGANFILKTDDDSFIDIFQLFDFTTRTYGYRARETLVCNVYPEGMKPVRVSDKIGLKWKVSVEEYPHSLYPKYCGGLAYLASPDVVRKVFSASEHVKFFWIDDVYVTGVLRELVQVDPFYLNLRYSYEPLEYRKWLEDRQPQHRFRKIPFMIVHVERGLKYSEEMNDLWRKTLQVWS